MHRASHDLVFARTSGEPGEPLGITAFIVARDAPGLEIESYWWTFNMPTDHAEVSLRGVRVGDDAILGELDRGLVLAQRFVHENRIRQAASSLGAAELCIDEAVKLGARTHRLEQAAVAQSGDPVPAGRAVD